MQRREENGYGVFSLFVYLSWPEFMTAVWKCSTGKCTFNNISNVPPKHVKFF